MEEAAQQQLEADEEFEEDPDSDAIPNNENDVADFEKVTTPQSQEKTSRQNRTDSLPRRNTEG